MKILFLTPGCFDKGGISRYSRYQIDALRQSLGSNNVKIISLLGPNEQSFEDEFSIDWYAGNNKFADKVKFIIKSLLVSIRWKPQVIHTAHINFSGWSYILARMVGAKSVLNVYGLEIWSGLSADAAYGLKHTNKIISDCHYTKNYIVENKLRKEGDIEVIWDCVDLGKYKKVGVSAHVLEKYGIPDPHKHFIILTLGRLSHSAKHKGYVRLLKVYSNIVAKYPDSRLVFAGKGDFKEELEQMAREMSIHKNIIFTGPIDENDMPAVYSSASVFSLVSERGKHMGEGIPLTPLEAMSCEVPIIVGNHDGSQEAIIEGKNGYIIDPYDLNSHIQCIENLIMDKDLRDKMGKASVKVSQQNFSFNSFKDKLSSFYKRTNAI